jgi:hypothetical protein
LVIGTGTVLEVASDRKLFLVEFDEDQKFKWCGRRPRKGDPSRTTWISHTNLRPETDEETEPVKAHSSASDFFTDAAPAPPEPPR